MRLSRPSRSADPSSSITMRLGRISPIRRAASKGSSTISTTKPQLLKACHAVAFSGPASTTALVPVGGGDGYRAWINDMTAERGIRRWPPGVFHEGKSPLSTHNCAVLTEIPSNFAAWAVVRMSFTWWYSFSSDHTHYGDNRAIVPENLLQQFDRNDICDTYERLLRCCYCQWSPPCHTMMTSRVRWTAIGSARLSSTALRNSPRWPARKPLKPRLIFA